MFFSSRRHPGALRRGRSTLLFQGRRLGWPDGSWLGCGRCLRLRLAGAAVLGLGLGVRRARDEPEQGGVCGGAPCPGSPRRRRGAGRLVLGVEARAGEAAEADGLAPAQRLGERRRGERARGVLQRGELLPARALAP